MRTIELELRKTLIFVSVQNIPLPKHSAVQNSTKYTHI